MAGRRRARRPISRSGRRNRGADRRQWRRQVDAAQGDLRAARRAGAARSCFDGERIERLSPRERVRARSRPCAGGPSGLRRPVGRREPPAGRPTPHRPPRRGGIAGRLAEVCERFPVLLERLHDRPAISPAGQQQMLAIARGLMAQPRLLLLDEPSLGLSPLLVTEIFRLIAGLREQGLAILLSEQNARQSLAIADRSLRDRDGPRGAGGAGRALLDDPEVAERYLGVGRAVERAGRRRSGTTRHTPGKDPAELIPEDAVYRRWKTAKDRTCRCPTRKYCPSISIYGGGWHSPRSGRYAEVTSPGTGESLGRSPTPRRPMSMPRSPRPRPRFDAWRDVPAARARQVLRRIAECCARTPDELRDDRRRRLRQSGARDGERRA